jgi:hypothetical protein
VILVPCHAGGLSLRRTPGWLPSKSAALCGQSRAPSAAPAR